MSTYAYHGNKVEVVDGVVASTHQQYGKRQVELLARVPHGFWLDPEHALPQGLQRGTGLDGGCGVGVQGNAGQGEGKGVAAV